MSRNGIKSGDAKSPPLAANNTNAHETIRLITRRIPR